MLTRQDIDKHFTPFGTGVCDFTTPEGRELLEMVQGQCFIPADDEPLSLCYVGTRCAPRTSHPPHTRHTPIALLGAQSDVAAYQAITVHSFS